MAEQALSDDRGALANLTAEISTLESEIKDANKQLAVAKATAAARASVEPQGSSSEPVPTQITPPIVCDISYDGHSFHLICHPG